MTENLSSAPETFTLPDGRKLSYALIGEPTGTPLLFFHGTPGSHQLGFVAEDELKRRGYYFIAPDRPGSGDSDLCYGRKVADWPNDVAALLDHLGLKSVGLVAISGGTPYALQTAQQLKKRVKHISILSGWASYGQAGVQSPLPRLFRLYHWSLRNLLPLRRLMALAVYQAWHRVPDLAMKHVQNDLSEDDRRLLKNPRIYDIVEADLRGAFTHGWQGADTECALQFSAPDVDWLSITQPVQLWHGTDDTIAHRGMAEFHAYKLPKATLHMLKGKGHLLAADPELQPAIFDAIATMEKAS